MAMMFGRFEIQSEISQSETALIYKATDRKTDQVVALKTQSLAPLGDKAKAFVATLLAEGERTRDLASQNIAVLYGAGEIEGQFCAAMEYIQGNSIATMLARKEGFSIWDLLDISRQLCSALECADKLGVVHSSLEPAKIMVQWDGLVKILGYGISNMSLLNAEAGNGLGPLMPYCSPEQIRGEAIDQRSNLFTLGAMLYEMVAGRRAFDAHDPVALLGQIENEIPAAPVVVNSKVHAGVSELIMKALAKDPAERYQSARALIDDLEKCKESSGKKVAAESKKPAATTTAKIDPAARAAAVAKFTSAVASALEPPASAKEQPPAPERRAAAAAAGASSSAATSTPSSYEAKFDSEPVPSAGVARQIELESAAETARGVASISQNPVLSSASLEQEPATHSPRIAVDPMMSGAAGAATGPSFSELEELPPLKDPVFTASPVHVEESLPSDAPLSPAHPETRKKEEKPKIQPRQVAEKVIKEVATIPPRLMLFSMLAGVAVILVVVVGLYLHVRSEDDGATAAPHPVATDVAPPTTTAPANVATSQPSATPAAPPVFITPPIEARPAVTVRPAPRAALKKPKAPAPPPMPAIIPGQAFVDSTPQGATFQMDGRTDPSWLTPFNVTGLSPGKHIVAVSKTGYTTEMQSMDIVSGGKSSLVIHLAPVNALMVVNSTPPGAQITLDGRVTGRVTPAQFAVEKGNHTVLLKKEGFLDETNTADLGPGQNYQYAPSLRALGNADDIRTIGRFQKLFKNGSESTAGMGAVAIRTQPKGAQVAINQRVLDKLSPTSVMMGPGNYVVDITLTGFKPIHKVIDVGKGDRLAIDEVLERE